MRPTNPAIPAPAVPQSRACGSSLFAATFATIAIGLPCREGRAQLPTGHLVLSSYTATGTNGAPGLGGLYFVDPATNAVTPVTGLPCEVIGNCANSGSVDGADVVARVPQTGQIVASAWGAIGQPISAFVFDLSGAAVVRSARYDLATVTSSAGLGSPSGAVLADGRVLLAIDPANAAPPGPLAGALLGILDPTLPPGTPGALTVVPMPGAPAGHPNSVVVDQALGVAYLGMQPAIGAASTAVYAVPVPAGGTPRLVGTVSTSCNAMTLEPDGRLLVGGFTGQTSTLRRLDPATGTVEVFPQAFGASAINALRIDPVSGDLFLVQRDARLTRLSPRSTTGTLQYLTNGGANGWGRPSGLDMNDELRTYGVASGTGALVRWQLAPNPGGAPALGNATFSLTSSAGTPGTPAFWAIGAQPLQLTIVLGTPVELLVAPLALLTLQVQAPPVGNRLTLALPQDPSLSGVRVYAQSFVLEGGGVAASNGLELTLR